MRTKTWLSIPTLTAGLWWGGCAHTQAAVPPSSAVSRDTPPPSLVAATTPSSDTGRSDLEAMLRDDVLHFDYEQASLTTDDQHRLENIATILSAHPDLRVRISGNCDERGTEDYNLQLGQERAEAAHRYLVNLGVDAARVATVSYGKDHPVNPGHSADAWAENRRDDIQPSGQRR